MVIALLIGMVVAAPPVIWHFSTGYQGVDMLKTNTEPPYVGFVQEVYDGHPGLGNPYLADSKDNLYLFPPFSANIIAGFGKLFFLSSGVQAVMVSRFFIVSALAFMIYLFCFALTGRRAVGIVAAPFVLLGYSFVDPDNIINLFLRGNSSQEQTFIDYGRPMTPQISALFFYSYLFCFWKSLQNLSKKSYAVLSVLILGLSFYVYLFTWTFLFTLNGFLVLVYIWNKEFEKVKKIIIISLGAFLMGLPYFWHIYLVSLHPWYTEVSTRFGFISMRAFYFSKLVIGSAILFIFSRKVFSRSLQLFFTAIFLTAIFVVNEQVITGKYIFNEHFHWYYNTPLMIIFLVVLLFSLQNRFFSKWQKIMSGLVIFMAGFLIFNGIMIQYASYKANLSAVIDEQKYAPLFEWLNKSTARDSVVLSLGESTRLIPALTHNNIYSASGGVLYTLIPDERFLHSYLVYKYLEGIDPDYIREYLDAHREDISLAVVGYRYNFGGCATCFPDAATIDNMVADYEQLTDENFFTYVRRYPLDYLVWDKKQNPEWNVDERWNLIKLQTWGNISAYDLRQSY